MEGPAEDGFVDLLRPHYSGEEELPEKGGKGKKLKRKFQEGKRGETGTKIALQSSKLRADCYHMGKKGGEHIHSIQ